MSSEYQQPLFALYPIELAFDNRIALAERCVVGRWTTHRDSSDDEIAHSVFASVEMYPLELQVPEDAIEDVGPSGVNIDTGEQSYRFDSRVSYVGDDELWNLDPGLPLRYHPDGEIFRRELIVVWGASCRAKAEEGIARTIGQIEMLIAAQRLRIDEFHKVIFEYILKLIRERRAAQAARTGTLH
jgi:hypothetical protein